MSKSRESLKDEEFQSAKIIEEESKTIMGSRDTAAESTYEPPVNPLRNANTAVSMTSSLIEAGDFTSSVNRVITEDTDIESHIFNKPPRNL